MKLFLAHGHDYARAFSAKVDTGFTPENALIFE
jgi:hypothetical protein